MPSLRWEPLCNWISDPEIVIFFGLGAKETISHPIAPLTFYMWHSLQLVVLLRFGLLQGVADSLTWHLFIGLAKVSFLLMVPYIQPKVKYFLFFKSSTLFTCALNNRNFEFWLYPSKSRLFWNWFSLRGAYLQFSFSCPTTMFTIVISVVWLSFATCHRAVCLPLLS